jgi:Leucine-rich repeat (LRR) protein
MNAISFLIFLLLLIATCSSIVIPCVFNFTRKHGYTCLVHSNFSNNNLYDHISEVEGETLEILDVKDVNRVVMYKLDVSYIPGNLTIHFPFLKVLQVKNCGLKNLTRSTELNRLRRLYLGFNEISEIPVIYFWSFCRLQILSLFGNRISDIPKMAFRDLKSLEKLSLSQNRLTYLHPYLFECTQKLTQIDLDGNQFLRVPSGLFANNENLIRLSMRNNQIIDIGNDFLSSKSFEKLEYVSFVGNLCINQTFNKSLNKKMKKFTLENFLRIFETNCSPPTTTTTTTPKPTTAPPRKKPPHQRQKSFYFENCEWHAENPNHRYF